jgi:outer membrane protein
VAPFVIPACLRAQTPTSTMPADSGARMIRLDEAIQLAQRNAPAAVQARGQLRSSAAAVRSAYGAFIPSFNVSASTAQNSPATTRTTSTGELISGRWVASQSLSLSTNLFSGGSRFYDLRTAKAQQGAAETAELAQGFQIALQVKQQFYAVLAARESEAAALAQLDQAQRQLSDAIVQVHARTATKSDSLRALVQVGNAQLALLTARNDRQAAEASLTRLVATPFPVTASPQDTVGEIAPVDSASLSQLVEQGPAVRQASAALNAAQASARSARAPYLPTLSLRFDRSRNGSSPDFAVNPDNFNPSGSLRFSLSYPIFNGFTREENVVRADVAREDAQASLRDARLAAQESFVQNFGALRTAQQQIDIQTTSVAAAEEDLRVQQQRYHLGMSTILDVLTSQTTLNQARAALIQARFNYRVAKAQLEALIGRSL